MKITVYLPVDKTIANELLPPVDYMTPADGREAVEIEFSPADDVQHDYTDERPGERVEQWSLETEIEGREINVNWDFDVTAAYEETGEDPDYTEHDWSTPSSIFIVGPAQEDEDDYDDEDDASNESEMKIWTITTASSGFYADIAVVAADEPHRNALVAAWEAEAAVDEFEAGVDTEPEEHTYKNDGQYVEIDAEDMGERAGQFANLTWRDLIADGAGVTMLDSGGNG